MKLAIYPGTFDPLTLGHLDMVKRAMSCCDRLVVAVARSTPKNVWFSLDERVALVEDATADLPKVEVMAFEGLLVDFAHKLNAGFLIRGVRAFSDFEYELQLALINRRLAPDVETMFMMPAEEFRYISSSRVREIAALNGDVSSYVTPAVLDALRAKVSERQAAADHEPPFRSAAGG